MRVSGNLSGYALQFEKRLAPQCALHHSNGRLLASTLLHTNSKMRVCISIIIAVKLQKQLPWNNNNNDGHLKHSIYEQRERGEFAVWGMVGDRLWTAQLVIPVCSSWVPAVVGSFGELAENALTSNKIKYRQINAILHLSMISHRFVSIINSTY